MANVIRCSLVLRACLPLGVLPRTGSHTSFNGSRLSCNVSDTVLGKREGPAVGKVFCQSAVDFVYIFIGSLSVLSLASLSPPSAPPSPCMTAIRRDAQDCVSPAKVHGRALHKDMPGPVHLACAPLRQRVHRTGVSTSVAAFAAAAASLAEIV